jgi:AGCS family alanine or glycine:cation symporter
MIEKSGNFIIETANFVWGAPLLTLLLGGGLFFFLYSKLTPVKYFGHAIQILRGKHKRQNETGQLSPYQALSTALAGTIGMGNISGVAVAISVGGPGAVFWMWITAILGVSTEFFTNTLAVMYRGKDSNGELQGGPMYFITEGLGKKWKPMALFFSVAGLFGVSPLFQANQLNQIIRDVVLIPNNFDTGFFTDLVTGVLIASITALVIIGGIKRIGSVTSKMVPVMVVFYAAAVLYILFSNFKNIIPSLSLIFNDAFTGNAVAGGVFGTVIITGVRRAAFSNEAGIGTTTLAHGTSNSDHPVKQGLVAMFGPVIDTIIVCTLTALAIIITDTYANSSANGITMTANAFDTIPYFGKYILVISVWFFAMSTLFAYPYYGTKCLSFLAGAKNGQIYNYVFIVLIVIGAVAEMNVVISIFDIAYALMAFPTIIAAVILAPKVKQVSAEYFLKLKLEKIEK